MAKDLSKISGLKNVLSMFEPRLVLVDGYTTWSNGKTLVRDDPNLPQAIKSAPKGLYSLELENGRISLGKEVYNKTWGESIKTVSSEYYQNYPKIDKINMFKLNGLISLEVPSVFDEPRVKDIFKIRKEDYNYFKLLNLEPFSYTHLNQKGALLVYFKGEKENPLGVSVSPPL